MILKDLLTTLDNFCYIRIFYICKDEPEFEGEHYDVPWYLIEKRIRSKDGICPFVSEDGEPWLRVSLEVEE